LAARAGVWLDAREIEIMSTEARVLALLDELAGREDVPGDLRERARVLADEVRPSPETVRLLAELEEIGRQWGEGS